MSRQSHATKATAARRRLVEIECLLADALLQSRRRRGEASGMPHSARPLIQQAAVAMLAMQTLTQSNKTAAVSYQHARARLCELVDRLGIDQVDLPSDEVFAPCVQAGFVVLPGMPGKPMVTS